MYSRWMIDVVLRKLLFAQVVRIGEVWTFSVGGKGNARHGL